MSEDSDPEADHDGVGPTSTRSGDGDPTLGSDDRPPSEPVDGTPTITCTRCDREWHLNYELDDLGVGNQAVEQFALDHRRHTGHFPDDVTTWQAECRRCPEGSEHLGERGARRWAETHARHTRHDVAIHHTDETVTVVSGAGAGEDRENDGTRTG